MEQTRFHTRFSTIGGLALVVGAILFAINFNAGSYFYGWVFWACMTFGCFALSLLHHMAKGSWGYPIMRLLEAGGGWKMLAAFGALFIVPVLAWPEFMTENYSWTDEATRQVKVVAHKMPFLDNFVLLTVVTFAVFIFFAFRNEKWQRLQDETGEEKYLRWRTNWSSGFFPFFVLFINFAFTMWVMSMKPEWFSTMYGVWFLVQQGLTAMALMAIIVGTQSGTEPFKRVVTQQFTRDIGNLMLVMTLLWAYFSFSQYLIIWSGNLPETISYWIERREGGYETLGAILVGGGFFFPFLLLLAPKMKREPKRLAFVGAVILVVRLLDMHYNVGPMFRDSVVPHMGDVGALLMFGGAWCLMFSHFVQQAPLLVKNQPQLKEAVDHA
ncbi:MAG: hypothetical protein WD716_12740 [Fimbriimonadaceae bacterium]